MDRFTPPAEEPSTEYKVDKVQTKFGQRYAVVHQGAMMFLQKEKEKAERIADRLNAIHARRITEIG